MGRWAIGGLIAVVLVVVGLSIAVAVGGDKDWGDHRDAEVVTTQSGETIVIDRDRGPFLFPFLLIPLVIIGLFVFLGGRRRHEGGPPWGGNQDWMREWHERQHREMDSRSGPPPGSQAG